MYQFEKLYENVPFGLTYIPQLTNYSNDTDGPLNNEICANQEKYIDYEMSSCNRFMLEKKFLSLNNPKSIVEIGVHRADKNFDKTSTSIFLKNKNLKTKYVGIDVDNKDFLRNEGDNIYTIESSSSRYDYIYDRLTQLGITQIDFLFIDSWHSVNHVIFSDWRYASLVSVGGIVGMHDTNNHPGPVMLTEAIDRDIFVVEKCCLENDHGIAFATRIK